MRDPSSLVIRWHGKGSTAKAMHVKLRARLDSTVLAHLTATGWIRALDRGKDIQVRQIVAGMPANDWLDVQIFSQSKIFPFHSLASLAAALHRPRSTIYDHLIQLEFTKHHLRWVPHALTDAHKEKLSDQFFGVMAQASYQGWKLVFTGDEFWFYFEIDYSRIWLLPD
jgi:hypothetical protein